MRPAKSHIAIEIKALKNKVEAMSDSAEKNIEVPKVGHKLHRLTTMTSKTDQFHLLAHGNPKPENLLVSPLVQFGLDGVSPNRFGFGRSRERSCFGPVGTGQNSLIWNLS